METSIRRRYPDSITSLIYASKSSEDDSSSNHITYLNNRVQQLEQGVEAKDKEMSLKIRSLHQKHTNMEVCVCVCVYVCVCACMRVCEVCVFINL